MKTYLVICRDAPGSRDKRPKVRQRHLDYWKPRSEGGQILVAGPMTDLSGSLFILRAESSRQVLEWMHQDPYVLEGVFESFEIHPFQPVLPVGVWNQES